MLYGLLMILIVFVLPQGIVPAIEKWFGVSEHNPQADINARPAKIQDTP
jgi:branched-chain amino acid transport system permease protein